MAPPQITEDEIDDLVYFARAGELEDLQTVVAQLAERENVSPAAILAAAKDEGKSTCLHMATGNGHLGMSVSISSRLVLFHPIMSSLASPVSIPAFSSPLPSLA